MSNHTESNRKETNTPKVASGLTGLAHEVIDTAAYIAGEMPLRFALLAILILQPLIILLFQPSYDTNDDVFMTMIASGKGICQAPDEHLVFTNVLIGQLLKPLYTTFPRFPWYGCYLLLTHYAAQVAILFCTLVIGRETTRITMAPSNGRADVEHKSSCQDDVWARFGLYTLYFALVEIVFLNRLQFTTTAFLASQAGVFLALLALDRRTRRADASVVGPLVAAVALLLVGGLIRLESLAMALLVSAPLSILFLKSITRHALAPCSVAMVAAMSLVTAAVAYDHWYYESDPVWHGFRAFNQMRGTFHDGSWTSYSPATRQFFDGVGWSENDHAMIERWFAEEPTLYQESKLNTIVHAYPWRTSRDKMELALAAIKNIGRNRSIVAVLLALPYALLVVRGGASARGAIVASAFAAFMLIVLVTTLRKVPPERVFFSLLSFPLGAALLSFAWRGSDTSGHFAQRKQSGYLQWIWSPSTWRSTPLPIRVVLSLMVVAMVMGVYRQARRSVNVSRDRVVLARFLDELKPADEKLYVVWEAALPFEVVSPLDSLERWSHASFLSLTWNQGAPWSEAAKRRFGITNLAHAIYARNDIEMVATPEHCKLFSTFAREHFGGEVHFAARWEARKRFVVGRFEPESLHPETATKAADAVRR